MPPSSSKPTKKQPILESFVNENDIEEFRKILSKHQKKLKALQQDIIEKLCTAAMLEKAPPPPIVVDKVIAIQETFIENTTPLHFLCAHPSISIALHNIILTLLDNGANLKQTNQKGQIPFTLAIENRTNIDEIMYNYLRSSGKYTHESLSALVPDTMDHKTEAMKHLEKTYERATKDIFKKIPLLQNLEQHENNIKSSDSETQALAYTPLQTIQGQLDEIKKADDYTYLRDRTVTYGFHTRVSSALKYYKPSLSADSTLHSKDTYTFVANSNTSTTPPPTKLHSHCNSK